MKTPNGFIGMNSKTKITLKFHRTIGIKSVLTPFNTPEFEAHQNTQNTYIPSVHLKCQTNQDIDSSHKLTLGRFVKPIKRNVHQSVSRFSILQEILCQGDFIDKNSSQLCCCGRFHRMLSLSSKDEHTAIKLLFRHTSGQLVQLQMIQMVRQDSATKA